MTSSLRDLRRGRCGRAGRGRLLPSFPNHSLARKNTSHWTVSHPPENVPPRWSPEPCHDWPRGRRFPFSLYFRLLPRGKAGPILLTVFITGRSLSGDAARLVGWLRGLQISWVTTQGGRHHEWMPARPPWRRQADYTGGSIAACVPSNWKVRW